MNTGTCLRPSWTAIVCPTMSGNTVEVRDQVRIMFLEPESFIFWMRASSRSSTKGPFFELLLNASPGDDFGFLGRETQAVQGRRSRSGREARARPRTPQCATVARLKPT